ncbi:MAG: hydrogenase maturation nickel metallochaperone HypA [Acidimicrobiales bacterium]
MHELSLAQAIADTVQQHAAGQPVERVVVRIGHLRQVVPDSLQFSWQLITAGTEVDGCSLEIEHVPASVVCRACGTTSTLTSPVVACEPCGSFDVELLTGEEFLIASLDLAAV